jgi:hypothetical protein
MSDPETDPQLPTPITPTERLLTAAEFQRLADVPPEVEWFTNITNRSKGARTRMRSATSCGSPVLRGRKNSAL